MVWLRPHEKYKLLNILRWTFCAYWCINKDVCHTNLILMNLMQNIRYILISNKCNLEDSFNRLGQQINVNYIYKILDVHCIIIDLEIFGCFNRDI